MLGLLTLVLRHSARASVITGIPFRAIVMAVRAARSAAMDTGCGGAGGCFALPDRLEP